MRHSAKLLLVGVMSAALPIMAATGTFNSVSSEDPAIIGDDAGFISPVAQSSSCYPDGYGGCAIVVTGVPIGGDGGGSGTGGGGGGGGGLTEGDASIQPGDEPSDPNNLQCKFGNGDVNVTFDGRTLRVTAKYNLRGDGAAASTGYIAGIEERWTKDFGDIAVSTHLTPDVNGFVVRVFGGAWTLPMSANNGFPYMDAEVGTNHWRIKLGSLSGVSGEQIKISLNMAAHEFGHFFFKDNKDPIPNDPNPSIMADGYLGTVKSEDLKDLVQFCRSIQ